MFCDRATARVSRSYGSAPLCGSVNHDDDVGVERERVRPLSFHASLNEWISCVPICSQEMHRKERSGPFPRFTIELYRKFLQFLRFCSVLPCSSFRACAVPGVFREEHRPCSAENSEKAGGSATVVAGLRECTPPCALPHHGGRRAGHPVTVGSRSVGEVK